MPQVRKRPAATAETAIRKRPAAQGLTQKVSTAFSQADLRRLAANTTLTHLEFDGSDVSKPAALNFAESGLAFPNLKSIDIQHWPLQTARFSSSVFPTLTGLRIAWPFDGEEDEGGGDWDGFLLQLPELKNLVLEYPGSLNCAAIKETTVGCPKLDYLCLYKAYNLGNKTLSLCLPTATKVWLHRCEDLKSVSVYGPSLKDLRLQACYDLRSVQLLERFPRMERVAVMTPIVKVDLTNSILSKKVIDQLKEHPRMSVCGLPTREDVFNASDVSSSDEEQGHELKVMHFSSTDNCGLYKHETAGSGKTLGVRIRHRCRGGKTVTADDMKRAVVWGAKVVYIWWVQASPDALSYAHREHVSVMEFKKSDPRPSQGAGMDNSPFMRFLRDVKRRAQAISQHES